MQLTCHSQCAGLFVRDTKCQDVVSVALKLRMEEEVRESRQITAQYPTVGISVQEGTGYCESNVVKIQQPITPGEVQDGFSEEGMFEQSLEG